MGFSIKENFKAIQWGPTLLLHLMRSVSAGVVWCIVALIAGGGDKDTPTFSLLFMIPFMYFVFVWFLVGVAKIIASIIPGIGDMFYLFISFCLAFGIVVGDPILFALNKMKPGILPVQNFNVLNFTMIMWILDPQKV